MTQTRAMQALEYAKKKLATAQKHVAEMSHHKQADIPFGLNAWKRQADLYGAIVEGLTSTVPRNIEGLHSKIDMDVEDELGRDITLEESKIIGLAIRSALQHNSPATSSADMVSVRTQSGAPDDHIDEYGGVENQKRPAEDNSAELLEALKSIAANTCCGTCQEAALVAKAAIANTEKAARG